MFHLIYLIPAVLLVIRLQTPGRGKIAIASVAAISLVAAVFVKNLLLFGFFGTSSWMGMNLWKVAPIGGKEAALAESPVAFIEPFSPLASYPESFHAVPENFAPIPALAAETKQNGKPNLNHFGYIAISEAYKKDALQIVKSDFRGYLGITKRAWEIYFTPARTYFLLAPENLRALKPMLCAPALLNRVTIPIAMALILFHLAAAIKNRKLEDPLFFLFCAGTIFYVALLGNLLENGENMRFRVQTDPLLWVAALLVLKTLATRLPSRRGATK